MDKVMTDLTPIELPCSYWAMTTFHCVDGYLHDHDYDYIDPDDVTYPCPQCNMITYFLDQKEIIEGTDNEYDVWEELIEAYCNRFEMTREVLYAKLAEHEELRTVVVHFEGKTVIHTIEG